MIWRIAIFGWLAVMAIGASAQAAPATQQDRAALLKQGVKEFQLQLTYAPATPQGAENQAQHPLTLFLAVNQEMLQRAQSSLYEKLAHVTEAQADKIIDELSDGILAAAKGHSYAGVLPAPSNRPGYSLMVRNDYFCYSAYLGFDLTTLAHLDALRGVLQDDSAKAMDAVLERLAPLRTQWTEEGRVFARDGLVLDAKPSKAELYPGQPIEIDLKIVNGSDKAFLIDKNLAMQETWQMSILAADGKTHYQVIVPPRIQLASEPYTPLVLAPGKQTSFALPLRGCQYLRDSGELRRNVPLDALPPGTAYTLTGTIDLPGGGAQPPNAPLWHGKITFNVTFALIQLR